MGPNAEQIVLRRCDDASTTELRLSNIGECFEVSRVQLPERMLSFVKIGEIVPNIRCVMPSDSCDGQPGAYEADHVRLSAWYDDDGLWLQTGPIARRFLIGLSPHSSLEQPWTARFDQAAVGVARL